MSAAGRVRTPLYVGLATFLVAIALEATLVAQRAVPDGRHGTFVAEYTTPKTKVESLMASGDGQAVAALAADPSLAHPERFPSRAEAAYRASRPFVGWLASMARGRSTNVRSWAVLVTAALGAGFLAAVLAAGEAISMVSVALLTMGTIASLTIGGSELWGLAFMLLAFRSRGWRSALFFALAALCRETFLVAAAAGLLLRKREASAAFAAYGAWSCVIFTRVQAWPWEASTGRLGLPLAGVIASLHAWNLQDWCAAALLVAGVVIILRKGGNASVPLLYVGLGLLMGSSVWLGWRNFVRPLLPIAVPVRSLDEVQPQTVSAPVARQRILEVAAVEA